MERRFMTMHPDQLEIGLDLVRRLVDRQFPQWADLQLRSLPQTGTVNALFRLGDRLAVRLPLQPSDDLPEQLRREAAAAAEVAEVVPVDCPRPVVRGRPSDDYPCPWSVQTWVDGEVATSTSVAQSGGFAEGLAALIKSLRAVPVAGRAFSGSGRGGRFVDHQEWVQLCLDKSGELLDVERLAQLWSGYCALPDEPRLAMTHGDLMPGNLLVDGQRLVGVIDCGGFAPADPALDLVSVWHLLEAPGREAVRRTLATGELEWARGQGWAFQQALGLVWYYQNSNPIMAAIGECTLERIAADPLV